MEVESTSDDEENNRRLKKLIVLFYLCMCFFIVPFVTGIVIPIAVISVTLFVTSLIIAIKYRG